MPATTSTLHSCCGRRFVARESLYEHWRGANKSIHPKCKDCGRGLRYAGGSHPPAKCSLCDRIIEGCLRRHYRLEPNHPQCDLCSQAFKDKCEYARHLRSEHGSIPQADAKPMRSVVTTSSGSAGDSASFAKDTSSPDIYLLSATLPAEECAVKPDLLSFQLVPQSPERTSVRSQSPDSLLEDAMKRMVDLLVEDDPADYNFLVTPQEPSRPSERIPCSYASPMWTFPDPSMKPVKSNLPLQGAAKAQRFKPLFIWVDLGTGSTTCEA